MNPKPERAGSLEAEHDAPCSEVVPDTVTILMPAYNEQDIIAGTVEEWHAEVVAKLPSARLLVVDDCSKDGTAAALEQVSKKLPRVEFFRREKNGGHGRALRTGFERVQTEYVFQTDSDRQHLPAEFWKFWELRKNYDFVFGVRSARKDGAFRRVVTTLMRFLNWAVWQVWIRDANCPFKLMRRDALRKVLPRIPEDSFIPMVMVSIVSRKMGFSVFELPVTHLQRTGGTQSLKGIVRWIRVGFLCAGQLLRLRLQPVRRDSS